mgnify:CR=1 FL=1
MKSLIRNSNQTKQGIDFTGIENGKIHPTDIDVVLEFDNWHTRKSIVLFVTHDFKDETKDIPLFDCNVEKYFFAGKWHSASNTLKNTLNKIGQNWNINKLKI